MKNKIDRLRIKVCGMRDKDNIKAVSALDIDMIGFIFYPKSPRYVSQISSRAGIIPDYSSERIQRLKEKFGVDPVEHRPLRVGVFVDDMPQNIVTRIYNFNLDFIQLHGEESPVMIENLKHTIIPDISPKIKIIKTLPVRQKDDFQKTEQYEGVADYFLFDMKWEVKGGRGKTFYSDMLSAYHGRTPFFVSGGIGPEDADEIKRIDHPLFVGIDVNSRFETVPGIKDVEKLSNFIEDVRIFSDDNGEAEQI